MRTECDPRALLELWERGEREHPVDRAITLLVACLGYSRVELADAPIPRRDALLLAARAQVFGEALVGYAKCPSCVCRVEVRLTLDDIRSPGDAPETGAIEVDGRTIEYRYPNSRDLALIAACDDVETATRSLVERCVSAQIDERSLAAVEQVLAEHAGASDASLSLRCPGCANSWTLAFDIGAYLWDEVQAYARRLLRDIDELAQRYGWSERDILNLSETRRRHYVELAS